MTNKSSVKQVVDNIFNTEKKIDVLVNNAGINLPRTLIDSKEEHPEYEINESDLDKMFAVNLKDPYGLVKQLANTLSNKMKGK